LGSAKRRGGGKKKTVTNVRIGRNAGEGGEKRKPPILWALIRQGKKKRENLRPDTV